MTRHDKTSTVVNLNLARLRMTRTTPAGNGGLKAYPRVTPDDPVLVTLFNGMIVRTRLGDLSTHGIKLRASRIIAESLHPSGGFIDIDNAPRTEISLDLPLPGGELRIRVRCRIARIERVSPDEVSFTLHFVTFEGAGEVVLRHYVNLCLAPTNSGLKRGGGVIALDGSETR